MMLLVQSVIAVMMMILTWQFAGDAMASMGLWQSLGIALLAFLALSKWKVHPAFVIVAAFAYGGLIYPLVK